MLDGPDDAAVVAPGPVLLDVGFAPPAEDGGGVVLFCHRLCAGLGIWRKWEARRWM